MKEWQPSTEVHPGPSPESSCLNGRPPKIPSRESLSFTSLLSFFRPNPSTSPTQPYNNSISGVRYGTPSWLRPHRVVSVGSPSVPWDSKRGDVDWSGEHLVITPTHSVEGRWFCQGSDTESTLGRNRLRMTTPWSRRDLGFLPRFIPPLPVPPLPSPAPRHTSVPPSHVVPSVVSILPSKLSCLKTFYTELLKRKSVQTRGGRRVGKENRVTGDYKFSLSGRWILR